MRLCRHYTYARARAKSKDRPIICSSGRAMSSVLSRQYRNSLSVLSRAFLHVRTRHKHNLRGKRQESGFIDVRMYFRSLLHLRDADIAGPVTFRWICNLNPGPMTFSEKTAHCGHVHGHPFLAKDSCIEFCSLFKANYDLVSLKYQ